MVQQLWHDDAAAMSVDDRSFAFLTKTICRIEAGEYDRDLERQTCAASGTELALRQVIPSESARTLFEGMQLGSGGLASSFCL
jgi:hypothetical protein